MNAVNLSPPLGRSAAELISIYKRFLSSCEPLDRLLGDGLPSGHILELSGPPGTAKDPLVVKFVSNAVSSNDQVLFVDMQNMTSPASLHSEFRSRNLPDTGLDLVHYMNIFTLPSLLAFLHNLPSFLEARRPIRLVVLNSIWFPFQTSPALTQSRRATLLARVKQVLARICSSLDISVVITNQLATKLLTPDGAPASFDTGSRAVLVPQLGGAYLPLNRTYRVLIVPDTRTAGVLRLLSHPGFDSESRIVEVPFEMARWQRDGHSQVLMPRGTGAYQRVHAESTLGARLVRASSFSVGLERTYCSSRGQSKPFAATGSPDLQWSFRG